MPSDPRCRLRVRSVLPQAVLTTCIRAGGCTEQWWISSLADLVSTRPGSTVSPLHTAVRLLAELTERARQEGARVEVAQRGDGQLGVRLVRGRRATWAATARHIVFGAVQAGDLRYGQVRFYSMCWPACSGSKE